MNTKQELMNFAAGIDQIGEGYESWGAVSIQRIAVRDGNDILITSAGATLSSLNENDIVRLNDSAEDKLIGAVFAKRKKINSLIITQQEYGSSIREEIPPILDDQAQLLGVSVRVADVSNAAKAVSKTIAALSSRYAAVCSDGRCICIGGSLDDAYIAAQLLEKTSKAWQEAKYLGGAKSINRFEAWAMQMYYQFKYAKEAKKNR
jgi:ribulose-5-phosphate 4-epimerase/fuculose-1-phosphate aldolase